MYSVYFMFGYSLYMSTYLTKYQLAFCAGCAVEPQAY